MTINSKTNRMEIKELEKKLIEKARGFQDENFLISGLNFFIPKSVFNPSIFSCAVDDIVKHIPFNRGKSFLDMGCGCGIYAILAAKAGCTPVYASDINNEAVHSTEVNSKENDVSVVAIQSDLFKNVKGDILFDIIWWHHPYNYHLEEGDTDAYFLNLVDHNYNLLSEFLSEAPKYLSNHGRIYLPNSKEIGCRELFLKVVGESNFICKITASEKTGDGASVDIFELWIR